MSTENFRRRTSALEIPEEIYRKYDDIVKACGSCQKFAPAPQRSKVSGMRAANFGDLWFIDHVDVSVGKHLYHVLVVIDAATNLIWGGPQKGKSTKEALEMLCTAMDELNCRPRALCADSFFMDGSFPKHLRQTGKGALLNPFPNYIRQHGIKFIPLGPHTPWPNRAEAAVKLFKHHMQILCDSLQRMEEEIPELKSTSIRTIAKKACWARNVSVTYG